MNDKIESIYQKTALILKEDANELAIWYENNKATMPLKASKAISKEIENLRSIASHFEFKAIE